MDLKQLERSAASAPAGVYVISGNDAAMKERALQILQVRLCDEASAEWCLVKVDGKEADGGRVLDLASTPPFLGGRRVVVVREAEALEEEERLIPFVEDPPGFSTLVLCYEEAEKARQRKLFQAAKKRGTLLEYHLPHASELPRRVARMAEEAGVALGQEAIRLLVERTGGDLVAVERELEKLAAYAAGATLSPDEVSRLVASGTPEPGQYAIFDFLDALAEGRTADALARLDVLLRAGEPPLLVLSMIARQLRLIYAALAFRGESPESIARALGLKSVFPVKKGVVQAAGWTLETAAEALNLCARCDAAMKSGAGGRVALEELAVRIAQARKRATTGRGSSQHPV